MRREVRSSSRNAAEEPESDRPRTTGPLPAPAAILALQRSAGNAAVAHLLQRLPVETDGGTFTDRVYQDVDKDGAVGVDIVLGFEPNDQVNATKIGLTQVVRSEQGGVVTPIGASAGQRTVKSGKGEGFAIDRLEGQNDPVYGGQILGPGQGPGDTATTDEPGKPVGEGDTDANTSWGGTTSEPARRRSRAPSWLTRRSFRSRQPGRPRASASRPPRSRWRAPTRTAITAR
jgi:hypothetical protein